MESTKAYHCGMFGRRERPGETNPDNDSSNNNIRARSRRRRNGLLPESDLHLEVSCLGVKPTETSTAVTQATMSSLATGHSDGKDQITNNTFSVPLPRPVDSNADSDAESEDEDPGNILNASVIPELATILSRAAALIDDSQRNPLNENSADDLDPISIGLGLSSSRSVTNGARRRELGVPSRRQSDAGDRTGLDDPSASAGRSTSKPLPSRPRAQRRRRSMVAELSRHPLHAAHVGPPPPPPSIAASHLLNDVMLDVTSQPPAAAISAPAAVRHRTVPG